MNVDDEIERVALYNAGSMLACAVQSYKNQMKRRGEVVRLGLGAVPGTFTDEQVAAVWDRMAEIGRELKDKSGR